MSFVEPVILEGRHARLEPLAREHADRGPGGCRRRRALAALVYERARAGQDGVVDRRRARRSGRNRVRCPSSFARPRRATLVGATRYFNVEAAHRRLEIGHTWYSKRVQRTAVNSECKLLLLTHAFEALDCIAVEFRTSFFNFQSREAIARLGAKQDGILRNHQIMPDGTRRDTVVFSIIANEWPAVKTQSRCTVSSGRVRRC